MLMKLQATSRVRLFGVQMDVVDMSEAVQVVKEWTECDEPPQCRFVVTPNVDHVVMLQSNPELRAAYEDAGLILADGQPVVWASRCVGTPLPERVPGSDLVPQLFAAADKQRPLRVFLLGAAPGVGQVAADNIRARWPAVDVVGVYSPPLGFEHDEQENERILEQVAECQPDVLIVGLGAPKQELWVHRHQQRLQTRAALCVGATIDFLAGQKARAPRWLQRLGLEWLHRLCSEPRRLFYRYARDGWIFPQLVWKQWRGWDGDTSVDEDDPQAHSHS